MRVAKFQAPLNAPFIPYTNRPIVAWDPSQLPIELVTKLINQLENDGALITIPKRLVPIYQGMLSLTEKIDMTTTATQHTFVLPPTSSGIVWWQMDTSRWSLISLQNNANGDWTITLTNEYFDRNARAALITKSNFNQQFAVLLNDNSYLEIFGHRITNSEPHQLLWLTVPNAFCNHDLLDYWYENI